MSNKQITPFEVAKMYRTRAYVPYSHFMVGASVETAQAIYGGCNVENASYGATICAERTAILKAVSEEGSIELQRVTVVTDTPTGVPPCAMCLQVIAEFGTSETVVDIANLEGVVRTYTLGELLPQSFTEVPV